MRPKAPPGTYWHRDVLYGVKMIGGKRYRWSLHTAIPKIAAMRRKTDIQSSPEIAIARRKEDVPLFDKAALRRKLAESLGPHAGGIYSRRLTRRPRFLRFPLWRCHDSAIGAPS